MNSTRPLSPSVHIFYSLDSTVSLKNENNGRTDSHQPEMTKTPSYHPTFKTNTPAHAKLTP